MESHWYSSHSENIGSFFPIPTGTFHACTTLVFSNMATINDSKYGVFGTLTFFKVLCQT